jgi:hypothetical protein
MKIDGTVIIGQISVNGKDYKVEQKQDVYEEHEVTEDADTSQAYDETDDDDTKFTISNPLKELYIGLLFGTVEASGTITNDYISETNDKGETIEYNAVNISTYNNSSSINFGVYNVTTAYMGTFGMIENTLLDLVIDLQFLKEIANVHLNWGKISYDNLYYGGIVGKINKVEDVYKKHLQISNAPATSTTLDMTKCDDDWKYSINISLYGALHYYYFPHLGGISTSTAYSDYFPDYSNESKITSTITVYTDREKSDREKTLSIYFSGDETTKGITWKKASEYTS